MPSADDPRFGPGGQYATKPTGTDYAPPQLTLEAAQNFAAYDAEQQRLKAQQWTNVGNTSGRALEPWQTEDRIAYNQAQAERSKQMQAQDLFNRKQAQANAFAQDILFGPRAQGATGPDRRLSPLNIIPTAQRVAQGADQYNADQALHLPQNPSLVPEQGATLDPSQQDQVRRFGRILTPQEEIELGYRKPIHQGAIEALSNPIGFGAGLVSEGINKIPTGGGTNLGQRIESIDNPVLRTGAELGIGIAPYVIAGIATGGVADAALGTAFQGQAAVGAAQSIGTTEQNDWKTIGANLAMLLGPKLAEMGISTTADAIAWVKANPEVIKGLVANPEVRARVAAGEAGGLGKPPAVAGTASTFSTSLPRDTFLPPPEITRLPEGVTPGEFTAAREANASGGVVRSIGALARKVDDLVSRFSEERRAPVEKFTQWVTHESTRFDRPIHEALAIWKRNRDSSAAWATETGNKVGRSLEQVFKGGPNATFRDIAGNRIKYRDTWLTNSDVVENWGRYLDNMTVEQYRAASNAGKFTTELRTAAAKDGVKLNQARGVDNAPVDSYVHRTTTSVDANGDRVYRNEFGENTKPGAKISAENSRDYTTRAQGLAKGVKYANSWAEEYSSHFRALQNRRADVALKSWTDQMSETITGRVERTQPAVVQALKDAAQARTDANAVLKERTTLARRNAIVNAQREVAQSERAIRRAQSALDRVTTAPKIEAGRATGPDANAIGAAREKLAAAIKEGNENQILIAQRQLDRLTSTNALAVKNPSRELLSNQIGQARERLAAATADLRNATQGSLESLKGRRSAADAADITAAKLLVEQAKQGQRDAKGGYRAAIKQAGDIGPEEALSPGGMPITQSRIFDIKDAGPLRNVNELRGDRVGIAALIHQLSQPFRVVFSTLDDSAALNQGWNTLIVHPVGWGKSVAQSFISAASPAYREHWIENHSEGVQFVQKYASQAWDANPDFSLDFSPTGTIFGKLAGAVERKPIIKYAGTPLRYSDRLFRDMRTMSAVHLAELWKTPGMTDEAGHELGSAITKIVGTARHVGTIEGEAAFAGSYLRSQIGLLADAVTNGGIQGAKARELFMKNATAAAVITTLFAVRQGKRPDQIAQLLNPANPDSFSVNGLSLLGQWKPLVQALASVGQGAVLDVRNGDLTLGETRGALKNDVGGRYARNKANPIIGKVVSALTGENSIGQPTSFTHEFLSLSGNLPFAAQAIKRDIEQGANPLAAIPAELSGARYSVATPYKKIVGKLDDLQIPISQFFGEPGTRQQIIAEHPELGGLYGEWRDSRAAGSVDQRMAEGIAKTREDAIKAVGDALRSGQIAPTDIKSRMGDINTAAREVRQALFPDPSSHDSRLDPLYAFYEDPKYQVAGVPDMGEIAQAQEDYLAQNEGLRPAWNANQFVPVTDDPVEVALKAAQKLVNTSATSYAGGKQATWFGVTDLIWRDIQRSDAFEYTKKYDSYSDWKVHLADEANRNGVDVSVIRNVDPVSGLISDQAKKYHLQLLAGDQKLGAALRVFYGVDLPDKDMGAALSQAIGSETQQLYAELGIK